MAIQHQSREPFHDVDEMTAREAWAWEGRLREHQAGMDVSALRLGHFLRQFRDRGLYRGRGYESFRDWVESPEVDLPYRKALDLIRIVERLLPVLGEQLVLRLGTQRARALLPLVELDAEGRVVNGPQLLAAAEDIVHLTFRDAAAYVRELRGRAPRPSARPRFLLSCHPEGSRTRVHVHVAQGTEVYQAGSLALRKEHVGPFVAALTPEA